MTDQELKELHHMGFGYELHAVDTLRGREIARIAYLYILELENQLHKEARNAENS
jgi:hypothetical protein